MDRQNVQPILSHVRASDKFIYLDKHNICEPTRIYYYKCFLLC